MGAVAWGPKDRRPVSHPRSADVQSRLRSAAEYSIGYFVAGCAAGGEAMQAPLPSLPPFSSHFILAFSHSALFAGGVVVACWATAAVTIVSAATAVAMGINLICSSFAESPREILMHWTMRECRILSRQLNGS
jgi:hypothetical protein